MINKKLIFIMSLGALFAHNSFAMEISSECRNLYHKLIACQQTEPVGQKAKKESSAALNLGSFSYKTFFKNAQSKGLNQAYKNIWCSSNKISVRINTKFITPGNLQWVAYLRNKYGANPVRSRNSWDNPILGTYKPKKGKAITITRYGFFGGLLNALDQLTDEEWRIGEISIIGTIDRLKEALEQALVNAGC